VEGVGGGGEGRNGIRKMNTANRCREMGLQIGDTIEKLDGGEWWRVTRLTLVWFGDYVAVWNETHIDYKTAEWTAPMETANWCLDFGKWEKRAN